MKKQIKDLELFEVDYLVAKAEGLESIVIRNNECYLANWKYSPTTNPAQAWTIIERERISVMFSRVVEQWVSTSNNADVQFFCKTSLEAAMRCYVASKFGNEVDI